MIRWVSVREPVKRGRHIPSTTLAIATASSTQSEVCSALSDLARAAVSTVPAKARELSSASSCIGPKMAVKPHSKISTPVASFAQAHPAILRLREQYAGAVLLVEDKGSGTSLIQDLRAENRAVIGINPEGDKLTRAVKVIMPV
jgi:prophage DNA circulation protein